MNKKDQEAIAKLYLETFDWDNPYKDDVNKVRRKQMRSDERESGREAALNRSSFERDRPDDNVKYKGTYRGNHHDRPVEYYNAQTVYDKLEKDLNISFDEIDEVVRGLIGMGDNTINARFITAEEDGNMEDYEYLRDSISEFISNNY